MFKIGNSLTDSDIKEIKESTTRCFGAGSCFNTANCDYALIYEDGRVVSSAVIDMNRKFIFNMCTHPDYRKRGYSKKIIKMLTDKYSVIHPSQLISLETENNEKGILPQKIYSRLNWINQLDNHTNYRNTMYFLPQTGICEKPNRLIKEELTKYGNFLKHLDKRNISIIYAIGSYILGLKDHLDFYQLEMVDTDRLSNYQQLFLHKDYSNKNILFNHLIFLENTKYCIDKIPLLKTNFQENKHILIIFVYENEFFIINKVIDDYEYIVSTKLDTFILLKKYMLN